MKKILVLSRKDDRESFDTQQSMARELSATGMQQAAYTGVNLEDLLFHFDGEELKVTDSHTGVDIAGFDLVFMIGWFKTKVLEDVALSAATYIQAKGGKVLNTEILHTRSRSKLSQLVYATLHNIPVTRFYFSMNRNVLTQALANGDLTIPYIAKAISASRGNDNYLFKSVDDLKVQQFQLESDSQIYYVVQDFVPNEGDYRILVMGSEVTLVLHRQSQTDSHLNNTSQGGKAQVVDIKTLPEQMLKDSITISNLLKREVTGVDMLIHKETGRYYLLEANNMPQLSTGAFVSEKMQALGKYFETRLNSPDK